MSARLEFTPSDVARTRIGPPLGPFDETVSALGRLVRGRRTAGPRGWLTEIKPSLTRHSWALGSFLWLSPSVGFDFFTVTEPTGTMRESRDALLDADREAFTVETDYWAWVRNRARSLGLPVLDGGGLPVVPPGLRDGTPDSRRRLFDDIAQFHQTAVAPWWPMIGDHLVEQREGLARQLGSGGVEAVWQALGPEVQWTGTALELPNVGLVRTNLHHYRLEGRGVVVRPSFFAGEPSVSFPEDPTAPITLIVPRPGVDLTGPNRTPAGGRRAGSGRRGRSTELLGPTRTAVLAAVALRPHTTTDLGRTLGIAISGASYHATVLRQAGLVRSTRDGGRVLHTATELGCRLLGQLRG